MTMMKGKMCERETQRGGRGEKRCKNITTVLELTLVTHETRSQVKVSFSLSLSLARSHFRYHTQLQQSATHWSRCNQLIQGSIEASVSSFSCYRTHNNSFFLSHSPGKWSLFLPLSSPLFFLQSIYFCGYFAYATPNDFNSFPLFFFSLSFSFSLLFTQSL